MLDRKTDRQPDGWMDRKHWGLAIAHYLFWYFSNKARSSQIHISDISHPATPPTLAILVYYICKSIEHPDNFLQKILCV